VVRQLGGTQNRLVWGGHPCPPSLILGLFLICSRTKANRKSMSKAKNNVKGSGQECPIHTRLLSRYKRCIPVLYTHKYGNMGL